jgi:apolipoprotein N-acyltransferase
VAGSETVAVATTAFGRLGGVICYDLDSPRYLRNAGREQIDVLMAPSGDWPAIKQIHARMAVMRAVEQGFSLVRPANHGLTLAADHQGRILATMDHYATSERQMAASIPAQGSRTLYTRIGDVLPWTCLALSVLFAAALVRPSLASLVAWRIGRRGAAVEAGGSTRIGRVA